MLFWKKKKRKEEDIITRLWKSSYYTKMSDLRELSTVVGTAQCRAQPFPSHVFKLFPMLNYLKDVIFSLFVSHQLLEFCLGPPASSLQLQSFTSLDKEPCPRGTRESKLVERKTSRIGNNIQETQMGCIAQVGWRFHFRSQPPIMGKSFTRV